MAGRFITFEGGEGAGKSTQIRRLADHLRGLGHAVTMTREPGGTPAAEAIREMLLGGAFQDLGPEAEALLFSAARADHLDRLIRPALARGDFVLCDRFIDSTRAYQGAEDGVDPKLLRLLEQTTVATTMPDLTIILDIAVETGLRRLAARRGEAAADRFEHADRERLERRRQAFLQIAAAEPGRCLVVDADRDEDAVAADIRAGVERLSQKRAA